MRPIAPRVVLPPPPGAPTAAVAPPETVELIDKTGTTGNVRADWRASAQATLDAARARLRELEPEVERLRKVIAALT